MKEAVYPKVTYVGELVEVGVGIHGVTLSVDVHDAEKPGQMTHSDTVHLCNEALSGGDLSRTFLMSVKLGSPISVEITHGSDENPQARIIGKVIVGQRVI